MIISLASSHLIRINKKKTGAEKIINVSGAVKEVEQLIDSKEVDRPCTADRCDVQLGGLICLGLPLFDIPLLLSFEI
jgi:hypothetical protein